MNGQQIRTLADAPVVLFAPDGVGGMADRVTTVVGVDFDTIRIRKIDEAVHVSRGAWCIVLVEPNVNAGTAQRVADLRRRHPILPRVVVTGTSARSVVAPAEVDAIVVLTNIGRDLPAEIRRVRASGIRAMVRLAATLALHLPPLVRRSIIAVARSARPFRTEAALAESLGCGRTTLWKAWHKSIEDPRPRLEHLLDWVLLVEAVARKSPKMTWTDVAYSLGLHEHTLARVGQRHAGLSLRALAAQPERVLSDTPVRMKLASLLGEQIVNELG